VAKFKDEDEQYRAPNGKQRSGRENVEDVKGKVVKGRVGQDKGIDIFRDDQIRGAREWRLAGLARCTKFLTGRGQ